MPDNNALLDVKLKLAKKYEHLATITASQPKRKQLSTRARKYRRQIEQMSREIKN